MPFCTQCGSSHDSTINFCTACGTRVAAAQEAAVTAAVDAALVSPVPPLTPIPAPVTPVAAASVPVASAPVAAASAAPGAQPGAAVDGAVSRVASALGHQGELSPNAKLGIKVAGGAAAVVVLFMLFGALFSGGSTLIVLLLVAAAATAGFLAYRAHAQETREARTLASLPPSVQHVVAQMDGGAQAAFFNEYERLKKRVSIAYLLWFFFGAHYFYLRQAMLNVAYWFTGAGFGFWGLIDLFRMRSLVRAANEQSARQALQTLHVGAVFANLPAAPVAMTQPVPPMPLPQQVGYPAPQGYYPQQPGYVQAQPGYVQQPVDVVRPADSQQPGQPMGI